MKTELDFPCHYCGASPGTRCVANAMTPYHKREADVAHAVRLDAYDRWVVEGRILGCAPVHADRWHMYATWREANRQQLVEARRAERPRCECCGRCHQ